MNVDACPVQTQVREVLRSARQFVGGMRRLRRAMRRCHACPKENECPVLSGFNEQLQQALAQVVDEWGLEPAGEVE